MSNFHANKTPRDKAYCKRTMLIKCVQCGLCYIDSNTIGQKLHARYHRNAINGIRVGSQRELESFGNVIEKFPIKVGKMGSIIEANINSRKVQKVLDEVLRAANLVLNSQDNTKRWHGKTKFKGKVFVCIYRARIIGICITETPQIGYWMIQGSNVLVPNKNPKLAIGIDRIFVVKTFRRHGIATRLLNAVASHSFYKLKLRPYQIGWSQPSHFGELVAKKYSGVVHPRSGKVLIPVYKQEDV